jgi:HSP20 family protein
METLVKKNGLFPIIPVNTFLDNFFARDVFDRTDKKISSVESNLPSVNLTETDDKLKIELALPVIKKESFKVEIDNNTFFIFSDEEK